MQNTAGSTAAHEHAEHIHQTTAAAKFNIEAEYVALHSLQTRSDKTVVLRSGGSLPALRSRIATTHHAAEHIHHTAAAAWILNLPAVGLPTKWKVYWLCLIFAQIFRFEVLRPCISIGAVGRNAAVERIKRFYRRTEADISIVFT